MSIWAADRWDRTVVKGATTGECPRRYRGEDTTARRLQQRQAPRTQQCNEDYSTDETPDMSPECHPGGSGRPREPAQELRREPQAEQYPGRYVDNAKEDYDPDENVNIGIGVEQQLGTENPRDGAARPDHRHVRSVA